MSLQAHINATLGEEVSDYRELTRIADEQDLPMLYAGLEAMKEAITAIQLDHGKAEISDNAALVATMKLVFVMFLAQFDKPPTEREFFEKYMEGDFELLLRSLTKNVLVHDDEE